MIAVGSFVKHPSQEWGIGRVLEHTDSKVRVRFQNAGMKLLDLNLITLISVEAPESFDATHEIDLPRLKAACERFYNTMTANRATVNDGRLAKNVMANVESRGHLTRSTEKQLAAWCTTGGKAFQEGVDYAREISRIIYGRVITREEVE